MSDLNEIKLIGNLGDNPTILKQDESGCFVRISLGTNKKRTDKTTGEVINKTLWTTVYFNNKLGKYVSSHYKKGDKVFITGELGSNQWKDKAGESHHSTAVYAKRCHLIARPTVNKQAVAEQSNTAAKTAA